jgi:hypothetical protein
VISGGKRVNADDNWNPRRACGEMAALFAQADEIINQPHYQDVVSGDELESPTADLLPTTEPNERT